MRLSLRGAVGAALALLAVPALSQPSPVARDTIGSGGSSVTARGGSGVTIAPKSGTALTVNGDTRLKGPHPWIDALAYGVKADGTTDDTAALQNAYDALPSTGGTLLLPAGTILVRPVAFSDVTVCLRLTKSNVTIRGEGWDKTTIKLADAADPAVPQVYKAIIGRGNTVISDVTVSDLCVDQNTPGNPVPPSYSLVNGRRNVIMACPSDAPVANEGNRLVVERVRCTNVCGTQTIVVSGQGSRISNCLIDYAGNTYGSAGAGKDFDTSALFITNGDGAVLENNVLLGRGPLGAEALGHAGAYAARSAMEPHGRNITVKNNTVSGFRYGCNIVAWPNHYEPADVRGDHWVCTGNQFEECQTGFHIYSHYAYAVTAATNTSPIQITTSLPNPYVTGDLVTIAGVTGNTAANVTANAITVIDPTHFTLNGTTGNGAFAGNGDVVAGGDWASRDNTQIGYGLDGLVVSNNNITLNRNAWYAADNVAFNYPNTAPRGLWIEASCTAPIRDFIITGNVIRFQGTPAVSSSADANSDGMYLSVTVNSTGLVGTPGSVLPNLLNSNWTITNNTIVRPVASGIHISARLRRCRIAGNLIVDPGQCAPLGGVTDTDNFAGIHLFGHLQGIAVTDNTTLDDQATPTTVYGVNASEPYTAAQCEAMWNRVQVTNPGSATIIAFHGAATSGKEWTVRGMDDPVGTAEYRRAAFGSEIRERGGARIMQQVAGPVGATWRAITYGSAAPTTGTWTQGDLAWNTTPTAGGPMGWVCTAGGSPGTWSEWGSPLSGTGAWVTDAISEKTGGAGVTFTGVVKAASGLSVGGGSTILHILHGQATLDFPSTPANSISELTMTVNGVSNADIMAELGVGKNGWPLAGGTYAAYVSGTNTVTVRFVNNTTSAIDPTVAVFEVEVHQY